METKMIIATMLALLLTETTMALPAADVELSERQNPFTGVAVDPYSGSNCQGTNQGNTNVNKGTSACINISNAKSFQLYAELCNSATIAHYVGTGCSGNPAFTNYNVPPGCRPKDAGNIGSLRITPSGC